MADPATHTVRIHYRRPPDREQVFLQQLVHRSPDVLVTLLEQAGIARPLSVAGETVLEASSPVVWFTFPNLWHDIGRFHLPDGTFTGIYANILTPVEFRDPLTWTTTDLFLDVWSGADRRLAVLDADELAAAQQRGWIAPELAQRARAEAARLLRDARTGTWPPRIVDEWTLERARRMRTLEPSP